MAAELVDNFDWKAFDFSSAPGVPQPAALRFLLAAGLRLGLPQAERAALLGLDALVKSEAFDSVEGGFFESCASRGWREPNTAKTLRLNAQMVEALAVAAQAAGRDELARAADETVAWVDRSLSRREDDLWASGQVADDEYYALMATQRSRRSAPAVAAEFDMDACATAASAFALWGAVSQNRALLGRARLALQSMLDRTPRGGLPGVAGVALAGAVLDVWCVSGDRSLDAPLRRLVDGLAISPAAGAAGERSCLLLRYARMLAAAGDSSSAELVETARAIGGAAFAGGPAAPVATARLASETGVIAVEGVAGSSLASQAFASCAPYGPTVLIDTSPADRDENRVAVHVPGRPAATARRRSELPRLLAPLSAAAAQHAGGGPR